MRDDGQKESISTFDGKLKRRAFFGACAAVGVAPAVPVPAIMKGRQVWGTSLVAEVLEAVRQVDAARREAFRESAMSVFYDQPLGETYEAKP